MQSSPVLAKTGCTAQFCQAGRMTRPLEPLLGDNRPLSVIKEEAEAFLREMRNEGMFKNDDAFEKLDLKWVKAPALSRSGFGNYFQALLDIHQLKLKF